MKVKGKRWENKTTLKEKLITDFVHSSIKLKNMHLELEPQ